MTRLLSLVSVRLGLYIAAAAGVSYLNAPVPAVIALIVTGLLVFVLGLIGPLLPFADRLPYLIVLLAVSAVTLGLGGLPGLLALLSGETGDVLAPAMRLVATFLGGLLFVVALRVLVDSSRKA